jgi:hypothetical protein
MTEIPLFEAIAMVDPVMVQDSIIDTTIKQERVPKLTAAIGFTSNVR